MNERKIHQQKNFHSWNSSFWRTRTPSLTIRMWAKPHRTTHDDFDFEAFSFSNVIVTVLTSSLVWLFEKRRKYIKKMKISTLRMPRKKEENSKLRKAHDRGEEKHNFCVRIEFLTKKNTSELHLRSFELNSLAEASHKHCRDEKWKKFAAINCFLHFPNGNLLKLEPLSCVLARTMTDGTNENSEILLVQRSSQFTTIAYTSPLT